MTTDPFDALRLPAVPRPPRPEFADRLRRRLQEELGMTTTEPITSTGQVRLVHIAVPDADRALAFFQQLFGWEPDTHHGDFTSHYIVNTAVTHVLLDNPAAPPVRLWFTCDDVPAAMAR